MKHQPSILVSGRLMGADIVKPHIAFSKDAGVWHLQPVRGSWYSTFYSRDRRSVFEVAAILFPAKTAPLNGGETNV